MFAQLFAVLNRIPDLLDDSLTIIAQNISRFAKQAFIRFRRFTWKASIVVTILLSLLFALSIFHELTYVLTNSYLHTIAWIFTVVWFVIIVYGIIYTAVRMTRAFNAPSAAPPPAIGPKYFIWDTAVVAAIVVITLLWQYRFQSPILHTTQEMAGVFSSKVRASLPTSPIPPSPPKAAADVLQSTPTAYKQLIEERTASPTLRPVLSKRPPQSSLTAIRSRPRGIPKPAAPELAASVPPAPVQDISSSPKSDIPSPAELQTAGEKKQARFVGGGVTAPSVLHIVEPEYSQEARAAKYQGTVILFVEVNPEGKATNMRVVRSLGLGLDEKAMEAVGKWQFKPGYKNGQPTTVAATVEVNFRLL